MAPLTLLQVTRSAWTDGNYAIDEVDESFKSNLDSEAGLKQCRETLRELVRSENHIPPYLSEAEKDAATIVHSIREFERRAVFRDLPSEEGPPPDSLDMGGQFLTNKQRIDEQSKLFQIAKLVPKGALLHLHFNTELDVASVLRKARNVPNMYIRSIRPLLSEEDLRQTELVFSVMAEHEVSEDVDIFSPDYIGNRTNWRDQNTASRVWMKWSSFRDTFDVHFDGFVKPQILQNSEGGSTSAAEAWVTTKLALGAGEVYNPDQTLNGIWSRFNQGTRCFKGLINYESAYKWYVGEAIDRLIEERVMYAELRPMLLDKSIPSDDGTLRIDNSEQMKLLVQAVRFKMGQLSSRKQLRKFPFGVKVIYCAPRSIPKSMMRAELQACIKLALEYPNLICGFDLVGAEDRPNSIAFYLSELVAFQRTCDDKGIKIPFLFHAGESLLDTGGSEDRANSNLYAAVALGAERIGHAFSLMKHRHLVEKFKRTHSQKGICVELCLVSNELLHLCKNVKQHPFTELLAAGIPCTLNTDNPNMFNNSMAHEFYQAIVGAPTVSLYTWKQFAQWSIEYSCLSGEDKKQALEIFEEDWADFCDKINLEYGWLITEGGVDEAKAREAYGLISPAGPKNQNS